MRIRILRAPAESGAAQPSAPKTPLVTPLSSLPAPAARQPASPAPGSPEQKKPDGMDSLDALFDEGATAPNTSPEPPKEPDSSVTTPEDGSTAPKDGDQDKPLDEDKPIEEDDTDPVDPMIEDESDAKKKGESDPEKEKTKEAEKPKGEEPQKKEDEKPRTPRELRHALRTTNDKLFKTIRENAELRKQLEKQGGPEVHALTEQLKHLSEEKKRLEDLVIGTDYKNSPEYEQKYNAPIRQAVKRANELVTQLEVAVPSPDGGEPTFRSATWSDFQALAQLPPGKVDRAAHEMFGHAAPRVIQHLDRIKELGEMADEAEKNAAETAKTREQQRTVEMTTRRENQIKAFKASTDDLVKQYPGLFAESEEDPEGSELLRKGLEWVDSYWSGKDQGMAPEVRAKRDALIRLRSAAFGRVARNLTVAQKKVAALEKELEGIRSTRPRMSPSGGSPAPGSAPKSILDGIDSIPLSQPG